MKILFVTYHLESTSSARFRSYFPAKSLIQINAEARVKLIYFLSKSDINWADIVIFQRIPQAVWYFNKLHLPISPLLNRILKLFRYSASTKPTGIDLDDYIFLKGSDIETGVPDNFLPELLSQSHFVTTTTNELALELSKFNAKTTVLRNALDFECYEKPKVSSYTKEIVRTIQSWKERGFFVLGWTCGNTHRRDFELFNQILTQLDDSLLNRIQFLLIGSKSRESTQFSNLVTHTRLIQWRELPFILKHLDANLVILEDNLLNQCKSELKLIEAGYFGVPSICSQVGVFTDLVYKGENGLLASSPADWIADIKRLMHEKGLRETIGRNIRKLVLENYDLKLRGKEYAELFEKHSTPPRS